ncbi:hypothetical protein [Roseateles depolymerans]|uniref:Uncharacterized protein n=1 Tax=Roseateles depolymerans TaxID=76731 RepID=A0A0U3MF29_9BURK|nr:hypothetical protein [Roseateles depolymerans]ALV06140.1 hypothetical protein RD2015_1656 [Roseateles depolymerans]REG11883.1 hypothetical protein DES44_4485 [Roseateles depolymerans]
MSMTLIRFLPDFAPHFLQALGVNLTVAAHAMSVGFPVGVALGVAQLPMQTSMSTTLDERTGGASKAGTAQAQGGHVARVAHGAHRAKAAHGAHETHEAHEARGAVAASLLRVGAGLARVLTALLRAAPAFVVMYVLLHAMPPQWGIGPEAAVALALAFYAAAYVADTLQPAVQDWRIGGTAGAQLFLTGLVRCFFVMVLSSGFGAAVGVVEATAVTLRALEQLPTTADRLGLMACVVLVFIALRQAVQAGMAALRRWIPARAPRPRP